MTSSISMVEDLRHGEILELKKRHPYRSGLLKHAENSSAVPRICAPNAQPPQVRAGEAKRSGPTWYRDAEPSTAPFLTSTSTSTRALLTTVARSHSKCSPTNAQLLCAMHCSAAVRNALQLLCANILLSCATHCSLCRCLTRFLCMLRAA